MQLTVRKTSPILYPKCARPFSATMEATDVETLRKKARIEERTDDIPDNNPLTLTLTTNTLERNHCYLMSKI